MQGQFSIFQPIPGKNQIRSNDQQQDEIGIEIMQVRAPADFQADKDSPYEQDQQRANDHR